MTVRMLTGELKQYNFESEKAFPRLAHPLTIKLWRSPYG